jgi:hypothetical protein
LVLLESKGRTLFALSILVVVAQAVAMVEELGGLFEANGDKQADDDGGDVEEGSHRSLSAEL